MDNSVKNMWITFLRGVYFRSKRLKSCFFVFSDFSIQFLYALQLLGYSDFFKKFSTVFLY